MPRLSKTAIDVAMARPSWASDPVALQRRCTAALSLVRHRPAGRGKAVARRRLVWRRNAWQWRSGTQLCVAQQRRGPARQRAVLLGNGEARPGRDSRCGAKATRRTVMAVPRSAGQGDARQRLGRAGHGAAARRGAMQWPGAATRGIATAGQRGDAPRAAMARQGESGHRSARAWPCIARPSNATQSEGWASPRMASHSNGTARQSGPTHGKGRAGPGLSLRDEARRGKGKAKDSIMPVRPFRGFSNDPRPRQAVHRPLGAS